MMLNFTMDERLNNFRKAWQDSTPTHFDLYDYKNKRIVPLNYEVKEQENEDGEDYTDEGNRTFKRVIFVPLHYLNSTVLQVPEPERQSADLFILEMPVTQVVEIDLTNKVHLRPAMYLSDPYSNKNFTLIVPSHIFV